MAVNLLQGIIHIMVTTVSLVDFDLRAQRQQTRYHKLHLPPTPQIGTCTKLSPHSSPLLAGTHMFLILDKGGHHHGECSSILTGNQGVTTGGED